MHPIEISLKDEEATTRLGAQLSVILAPGDAICLSGDLGAGKSTLARGMIKCVSSASEVPSPTFTFIETYETERFLLWHFDLYRLERPEDVWELGYEDALENGVMVIEWPERIGALAPLEALGIHLEVDGKARKAHITGAKNWRGRLLNAGIA